MSESKPTIDLTKFRDNLPAQIAFMNITFGKPTVALDDPNYWAKLLSQHKIIQSEVTETIDDGILPKSLKLTRDGICDMLVTVLGLGHLAGFDVIDDMFEVFKSNMSKVCPTMEDAQLTSRKYWDMGVATKIEPSPTVPGFIVRVDGYQEIADEATGKVTAWPDGKFLKSVGNFKEPEFFWDEEAKQHESQNLAAT